MNRHAAAICFGSCMLVTLLAAPLAADDRAYARDGSGVYGYRDTPIMPWSGYHVHDPDCPVPPRVKVAPAAQPAPAPSDAVVLFDGKDLSKWRPTAWKIVDGTVEAADGSLTTREGFGACQVHLEWMAPVGFEGPWYNRGNSGVAMMGLYEVQIFDSYNEKIYPDGMAAALYGQAPPLVNACLPPGEWQTFDIMFTPPVFQGEKLVEPGRFTVLHNGVLVHLNAAIHGETDHRKLPVYKPNNGRGPLVITGHNCPVRFRNIWLRKIAPPTTRPS